MKSSQSSKGDRKQTCRYAVPVNPFAAIPTTWGPKLLCHQSCWPAWYFSQVGGSIWIQQWEKLWITMDLCVQIVFKELKTIQKPLEIFSIFTLLWYCFTKITPTFWAPPRYHRHIHIPFSFPFSSELKALNHIYDHNKDLPPGPVQQTGAPKTGYWRNVMLFRPREQILAEKNLGAQTPQKKRILSIIMMHICL